MNAKHENIGSDVFRSGVHGVNETVSIRLRCRCGWISKMCPDEWEARRELLKHMHEDD